MKLFSKPSFWLSCFVVVALIASLAFAASGAMTTTQKTSNAFLKVTKTVISYGATGNGSIDDYSAINTAINTAAAGINGGTVQFPAGTYRLGTNLTVPANVELVFAPGASLLIDSGVTLTLNGAVAAGDQTIFSGSGTVAGMPRNGAGNPMWFGAVADGVTDCSAAFNKALAVFTELEVPSTTNGFVLTSVSLPRTGTSIRGRDNQKAKIIASPSSTALFEFKIFFCSVSYLDIDMSRTTNANSTAFLINDSTVFCGVNINNIDTTGAYCVVKDSGNYSDYRTYNVHVENMNMTKGRGTAFRATAMMGFIFFNNSVIDYSASAAMTYPAISIANNQGILVDNVQIIGSSTLGNANSHGIYVTNSEATWFQNCNISNMGGDGIHQTTGANTRNQYLYLNDNTITNCANGINLYSAREVQIHANNIYSIRSVAIHLNGGTQMQLSNNIANGSNNGIYSTASYVVFTTNETKNNLQYGLYSSGSGCVTAYHGSAGNGLADRFTGTVA